MLKKQFRINYFLHKLNKKIRVNGKQPLPWLPFETIQFLDHYLFKSDTMLETGSGRSTIWFAKRVQKITSIEHDENWFNTCNSMLREAGLQNVEYFLCNKGEKNQPESSPYFQKVLSFPDKSFDFILVDGKLRVHIANLALDKVKEGGLISIDNIERELYLPDISLPDSLSSASDIHPKWQEFLDRTKQKRKVILNDGITANMLVFL